ncbi:putative ABC transporter ATP-binding protein [Clostridia bacterium]|nr:putative ABC transporter ATP-binding protein [Clostridia bacterium]
MLSIQELSAEIDNVLILQNISCELEQGSKTALIGANGAGKSTLLLAVAGVIPPKFGTIDAKNVGMVFQNPDDQLFMPTVQDDISFGLRNYNVPEEEVSLRVSEILGKFGITHLRDRLTHRLSGGEKRIAALAGVLVMRPSVLLLDEPTSFLDPKSTRVLMELLKGIDTTMLIATHDLVFADNMCDSAILLKEGTLYKNGNCREILSDKDALAYCGL